MTAPEQEPAVPTCTAARCTRPQAAGSQLCQVDGGKLGDYLADIKSLYEDLSAEPSMQGREVGTIGGTTLAAQRNPGRLDVMMLRDSRTVMGPPPDHTLAYPQAAPKGFGPWCLFCEHETCTAWRAARRRDIYDDEQGSHRRLSVLGVLHGWAENVRDGRDLAEPVIHVPACLFPCMHRACLLGIGHAVPAPLTVARERKLLATHLPWILGQDWAGEFHDEVRGLWSALRSANGHAAPKTRGVRCPETVNGEVCGGPISWLSGEVTCGSCGARTIGLDVIRRHSAGEAA